MESYIGIFRARQHPVTYSRGTCQYLSTRYLPVPYVVPCSLTSLAACALKAPYPGPSSNSLSYGISDWKDQRIRTRRKPIKLIINLLMMINRIKQYPNKSSIINHQSSILQDNFTVHVLCSCKLRREPGTPWLQGTKDLISKTFYVSLSVSNAFLPSYQFQSSYTTPKDHPRCYWELALTCFGCRMSGYLSYGVLDDAGQRPASCIPTVGTKHAIIINNSTVTSNNLIHN